MNHSLERHRRLYGLLRDTGTERYRHVLVYSFSGGRTENSADLTDMEVNELIRHLERMIQPKPKGDHPTRSGVDYRGQTMRRRILSLCYTMGWTVWDLQMQKHQVDWNRLNGWMLKYGYLHKPLNRYSYSELQTLVKQFEHMATAALNTTENTTP